MTTKAQALEAQDTTLDKLMRLADKYASAHADWVLTGADGEDQERSAFRSALEQLIESAGADGERLDALQSANGHNQWIVAQGQGSFTVSLLRRGGGSFATRKTLREAIDAARSPQPGDGP